MSFYAVRVSASSTVYSGLATPDVSIPFNPTQVRIINDSAGGVEASFDGPPAKTSTFAAVLPPSPHPAAVQDFPMDAKSVWVRNLVAGSTAEVIVQADDNGRP